MNMNMNMSMDESKSMVKLPGFRFHPTEEELLNFYLKNRVFGNKIRADVIGFLNIYNHDPKDLPRMAKSGEREWYFFVPRDRKHGGGGRPNRTTEKGFWKATGSDRQILTTVSEDSRKVVLGFKKTLVFYEGRAPRGRKTNWIMNEYRLPDHCSPPMEIEIVVCKIYMKATSLKELEQRSASAFASVMEEATARTSHVSLSPPPTTSFFEETSISSCSMTNGFKRERDEAEEERESKLRRAHCSSSSSRLVVPDGLLQNLGELQVPKLSVDWAQDSIWTQLSPWLENLTPFLPMC